MGMQIDRRPIDERLLNDDDFYDFFLEETEGQEEVGELDADNIGGLMRDSAYIDELYKKYKGEKGAE